MRRRLNDGSHHPDDDDRAAMRNFPAERRNGQQVMQIAKDVRHFDMGWAS